MRYSVLGPIELHGGRGSRLVPHGAKQRLLLAGFLLHAPRVVSADRLIDLLWGNHLPARPAAALQTQVSRLRAFLHKAGAGPVLESEPYGYRLSVAPEEVDEGFFEALVAKAKDAATAEDALVLLEQALALWRGDPYEEFADLQQFLRTVTRLRETRNAAEEQRAALLLALGRTDEAVTGCEALIGRDPLRERPRALLMEALYRSGRQSEALDAFQAYRRLLSEELGLDPSPVLRQLQLEILRHERALGAPVAAEETRAVPAAPMLSIAFANRPGGGQIAYGEAGDGPSLVVLPAWVSSLAAVTAGSDPRSALLDALSQHRRLILYDRYGMGLSRGESTEVSLETDLAELALVMDATRIGRAPLLAISQAGPPALAFAARHPDRVSGLVLIGTYACATRTFPHEDLRASMVALVRAHWGIGSTVISDLIIPGATREEAAQFARVQRESATPGLAARALQSFYAADVTDLLPSVRCPALVIHYRGDPAIPFRGGEEIAALLPGSRLIPFDGDAHLPRSVDIPVMADLIAEFLLSSTHSDAPVQAD